MAARFFVNGGVDNNWGTAGNWSATSGGGGGAGVPTTSDDVTFDASSPNCTINTTGRVALSLVCTAYANTLTFNATLSVSGTVTLGASMVFAGSSALIKTNTGTLTSNGKTIGVPFQSTLGGTSTLTLADNAVCGVSFTHTAGTLILNGNQMTHQGDTTVNGVSVSGTTTWLYSGTSVISGSGTFGNSLTINTAGTVTYSGTVHYATSTNITYTAGTVVTAGSKLGYQGGTLSTAGIVWNDVEFENNNATITLSNDVTMSGTLSWPSMAGGAAKTVNGNSWNMSGGSIAPGSSGATRTVQGTTTFKINATALVGGTSAQLRNTLRVESGANTITGSFNYGTGTWTYVAGSLSGSGSLVFTANGTIDFGGNTLDCGLVNTTAGVIITLTSGVVMGASRTLQMIGTSASPVQIKSSVGGTQRKFTVPSSVSQDLGYVTATDIDSSDAGTVRAFKPTLSNTLNWSSLTPTTGGATSAGAWAYA